MDNVSLFFFLQPFLANLTAFHYASVFRTSTRTTESTCSSTLIGKLLDRRARACADEEWVFFNTNLLFLPSFLSHQVERLSFYLAVSLRYRILTVHQRIRTFRSVYSNPLLLQVSRFP